MRDLAALLELQADGVGDEIERRQPRGSVADQAAQRGARLAQRLVGRSLHASPRRRVRSPSASPWPCRRLGSACRRSAAGAVARGRLAGRRRLVADGRRLDDWSRRAVWRAGAAARNPCRSRWCRSRPLKWMATGCSTLRSGPPHFSHVSSGSSLIFCKTSNECPQSSH